VLFTGHFEHTIDAKGRLAIPAEFRSRWRPETHGSSWFAIPWDGGVIRLYTETGFTTRAAGYSATLTPDEDEAELLTTLFGMSRQIEMDSAGRVRLPDDMLALTGLGSEVSLVGAGDWLEVRDRAAWKSAAPTRLQKLPELMRRLEEKRGRTPGRSGG
jgi:MraZ protein